MKKIIVLMGGSGSGKGSVAEKLCEKADFNCIETGALFRSLPENYELSQLIIQGKFAPDDKLFELLESKINNESDIVLDGFPRTLPQAQWLVSKYAADFDIKIIYIDITPDLMKQRIQKRYKEGSGRADDSDENVIQHRLENFYEQTTPAIEWLRENEDIEFIDINGAPNINAVFKQVMYALSA